MLKTPTALFVVKRLGSNLSYVHCPGEQPLSALTVGRLLDQAAQLWGPREALVSLHQKHNRITFNQLKDNVTKIAAGFLRLGLNPGDRLGIWASNCLEWEVTQLAAAKTGLVLVNINPAYQAQELRHCLQKVGVRALLEGVHHRRPAPRDILQQAVPDLQMSGTGGRVQSRDLPALEYLMSIGDNPTVGALWFEDLLEADLGAAEEAVGRVEVGLQPDEACNIQFTSGTTGRPKATLLSHHGIVNNGFSIGKRMGLGEKGHVICLQVPFFHCFGCVAGVLSSLHYGATLVLPGASFSTKNSWRAIQAEKCSVVYGTPTMHVDLVHEARTSSAGGTTGLSSSLEVAVTGGALCSEPLFNDLKNTFNLKRVISLYGMTECSPVNFQTLPNDDAKLATTTVGPVGEHWEAKVVDTEGRMVPYGHPGELWVRGYGNMLGYWNEPEATCATLRPDGWLRTGDQFILDAEGYGRVVGRIKDVIIRGGENIFPREVEDLLHTHPAIIEAQVFGIPDKRLGEVVCAAVRAQPGQSLTSQKLKEFCKEKIAHFKIPLHVRLVDDFPKTASGKIQKFRLREIFMAEL